MVDHEPNSNKIILSRRKFLQGGAACATLALLNAVNPANAQKKERRNRKGQLKDGKRPLTKNMPKQDDKNIPDLLIEPSGRRYSTRSVDRLRPTVAVLRTAFSGEPIAPDRTDEIIQGRFRNLQRFVMENSLGRVNMTGDVFGPFTVPNPFTNSCWIPEVTALANAADSAAASSGINLNSFDFFIYFFPRIITTCVFGGIAENPPDGRRMFANHGIVLPHEWGHTGDQCHHAAKNGDEYGDYSCTMSRNLAPPFYNTYHKVQAGFTNPIAISGDRFINIGPSEILNRYDQAYMIPIPGTNEVYILGRRERISFDQVLTDQDIAGLEITRGNLGTYTPSDHQVTLGPGGVFRGVGGITIRLIRRESFSYAAVSFGGRDWPAECENRTAIRQVTPTSEGLRASTTIKPVNGSPDYISEATIDRARTSNVSRITSGGRTYSPGETILLPPGTTELSLEATRDHSGPMTVQTVLKDGCPTPFRDLVGVGSSAR